MSTCEIGNVDLSRFRNDWYNPESSFIKRALWHVINAVVFMNPLVPYYVMKVWLLKAFGARIGRNVVIKPRVNIKYPWFLEVGDNSWIGEGVWIDNSAKVMIGRNACISQGAFILTGNHDYRSITFDLLVAQVIIEDGVWIGAGAIICPNVLLRSHSVVKTGCVVKRDTEEYGVYGGNPAVLEGVRQIG